MKERVIDVLNTKRSIGCCGGHSFKLISVNDGYTTECVCGIWSGQWYPDKEQAVEHFLNMIDGSHADD